MSSVGQAVGGIVGGVIGFFVGGGPSGALYGAQVGMMVGGVIDPPPGPVINGPRLDDLSVQTSTYGAFIPRNYGTMAQTGNIFWIKGDALTETPVSTQSGGKGGPQTTTNTWEYSATFAVGLCEGPIDGVRRIWIGNQLWYDAGSDDVASIIVSNSGSKSFTLYLGTEEQLPDPLIQADKGINDTPAYRGLAYIVFENLPLKDYSNSLVGAQVKVEIVKAANLADPRLLASYVVDGYPLTMYPRPSYDVNDGVLSFYSYNPFAGTTIVGGERIANSELLIKMTADGVYIGAEGVPLDVVRPQFSSSGLATILIGTLGDGTVWWPEHSESYAIQNGVRAILPYGIVSNKDTASVVGSLGDIGDHLTGEAGRYVQGVAITRDEQKIIVFTGSVQRAVYSSANRYFVLDTDLNVIRSGSISDVSINMWNIGETTSSLPDGGTVLDDGGISGWTAGVEMSAALRVWYFSIDETDTLNVSSILIQPITGIGYVAVIYGHALFHVLVRTNTVARLYAFTAFPSISSTGTTLAEIIQAECLTSSLLNSSDIDVTDLPDQVRGYRIASMGAIRGGIDPLRAAWPFDVVQHGYTIKFKRRGSASVATIDASEMDAREAGGTPGVQITNTRDMDTLLPRLLTLKYIDADREYDTNEQPAQRGQ